MSVIVVERSSAADLIAAVRACRSELELNGEVESVAGKLCTLLPPGGSFRKAEPLRGGYIIAVWLKHKPTTNPPTTKPRYVDLLFFAAMLLMDFVGPGQRFWFEPITNRGSGLLYYIRYGLAGGGEGERIYWARVVRDTPADKATPFARDHYSYRYSDLTEAAADPTLPRPQLGRAEAVTLAGRLYEVSPAQSRDMTRQEYETLLGELFRMGDHFHSGVEV